MDWRDRALNGLALILLVSFLTFTWVRYSPGLPIMLALGLLMLGALMVTLAAIQWAAGRLRGAEAGAVLLVGSAFAASGGVRLVLPTLSPLTAQISDGVVFLFLAVALVVWIRTTRASRVSR